MAQAQRSLSGSERLSVKQLVELTCQRGDLYTAVDGRATAEEGMVCQQTLQRDEVATYECEAAFDRLFAIESLVIRLRGRADGRILTGAVPVVDEIKTSRAEPRLLESKRGHLHWAQLRLYAALQALDAPRWQRFSLRLRYVHPDTRSVYTSERTESRDSLLQFLWHCLHRYSVARAALLRRRRQRDATLLRFEFPLPAFRANQRALAARVFQALSSGEPLLLQASTGIGKSIGVLFPALRAFGRGPSQRYFYLTARRTGALAAVRALRQLNAGGAPVRWLQLQSKGRLCQQNGSPCVPTECPKALGYYDRVGAALEALAGRWALDPAAIEEVATAHQVCPFELSLDAARSVDVLIADYNYVFDPDVRLQRFVDGSDIGLLIDEAHQLAPRTLTMLGAQLQQPLLRTARTQAGSGALRKRLDSVQRALSALSKSANQTLPIDASALNRAVDRLLLECATLDWNTELSGAIHEFLWAALRWQRRAALLQDLPSALLLEGSTSDGTLQLRNECLDAAPYLQQLFAGYAADIRFSGTLQPPALYQRLHGRSESAVANIASPYQAEQLAVCIVRDVPTYYRARAASLPALAQLIEHAMASRPGTFLVALPSFAYLEQLQYQLEAQNQCPQLAIHAQQRGMTDAEQSAFLRQVAESVAPQLVLVVLGGVFAESVDFTDITLAGVVCVGVGLPPPSTLRDAQQSHFEDVGADGALAAYTQPAMVKVVQMAGRLLRGPDDRGALLLVDERFAQRRYAQFFPDYWQPQVLNAAAVPGVLEKFWSAP